MADAVRKGDNGQTNDNLLIFYMQSRQERDAGGWVEIARSGVSLLPEEENGETHSVSSLPPRP
jgi:hypothetical protein